MVLGSWVGEQLNVSSFFSCSLYPMSVSVTLVGLLFPVCSSSLKSTSVTWAGLLFPVCSLYMSASVDRFGLGV